MRKKKKRLKLPMERNYVVEIMRLHCKPGPLPDKKKEADRRACRKKLRPGDDFLPAFFPLPECRQRTQRFSCAVS